MYYINQFKTKYLVKIYQLDIKRSIDLYHNDVFADALRFPFHWTILQVSFPADVIWENDFARYLISFSSIFSIIDYVSQTCCRILIVSILEYMQCHW